MPERPPTWLVTGAQGFLGATLGATLAGRAHRVGAARTAPSGALATYDDWVSVDLREPQGLAAWIEEHRPEIVLHAAAMATHEECEADPSGAELVNADAAGILSGAAQRAGSRFVLISTDAVFDGGRGHYSEDDEPAPFSVYGHTKRQGELLALANPAALVVRTNFFGWSPTGRRSILEFFVNALSDGQRVRGFTDFTVTSAYAPVLCGYLERLVARDVTGLLHLTSPDALTKYAFGVAVAEEFGLDPDLIAPMTADVHPPRNRDLSLDVSRAEALLGAPLVTQREGIVRAHADAATLRPLIRQ